MLPLVSGPGIAPVRYGLSHEDGLEPEQLAFLQTYLRRHLPRSLPCLSESARRALSDREREQYEAESRRLDEQRRLMLEAALYAARRQWPRLRLHPKCHVDVQLVMPLGDDDPTIPF